MCVYARTFLYCIHVTGISVIYKIPLEVLVDYNQDGLQKGQRHSQTEWQTSLKESFHVCIYNTDTLKRETN